MTRSANRRRAIYEFYREQLEPLEDEGLLGFPGDARGMRRATTICFTSSCPTEPTRDELMAHLQQQGIHAVFHYVPLHTSPMGQTFGYREGDLPVTEEISGRLLRLPLYHDITEEEQRQVVAQIFAFGRKSRARRVVAGPARP